MHDVQIIVKHANSVMAKAFADVIYDQLKGMPISLQVLFGTGDVSIVEKPDIEYWHSPERVVSMRFIEERISHIQNEDIWAKRAHEAMDARKVIVDTLSDLCKL